MFAYLILAVVALGVVATLARRIEPGPSRGDWVLHWPFPFKPWHAAVAVVLGVLLFAAATVHPHEADIFLFLAGAVVAGLLLRAWRLEFLFLMDLREDDLPGRVDKPIWAALLIVLPPVGYWCFRSYRQARWPELEPGRSKARPAPDLS